VQYSVSFLSGKKQGPEIRLLVRIIAAIVVDVGGAVYVLFLGIGRNWFAETLVEISIENSDESLDVTKRGFNPVP